ncbi:MAG: D-alanyl-D-alanine carboxypeptidase family protein [Candidatus Heteroscillospira sp.]|jgi:D-alanyl-D-alanine carboxypeptidase (penicillin-binding protein 5/6)
MKKLFSAALCAVLLSSVTVPSAAISADTAGEAILIHADTGRVLYEKNADSRALIASTTKIMTALVVLEHCGADEVVEIPPSCAGIEGSSMYLKAGEEYTVRELLCGMLLVSGNDAAAALACHVSGSEAAFARLMNQKAEELGLKNTSFKNPHGLDAEGHYSTAGDLAVIMRAAMENPDFAEINAMRSVTIGGLTFTNHNKLLWRYEGCIGGKTGYTMAAGRSLVSCAERDGLRLICVTLSDPDDWNTHTTLYDWAFAGFTYKEIRPMQPEMSVPLISGKADMIKAGCPDPQKVLLPRDAEYSVRIELPGFVYAPISRGEVLGAITVSMDGEVLGSSPLVAMESAVRDNSLKLTAWERFRLSWYRTNRLGLYYPAFRSAY